MINNRTLDRVLCAIRDADKVFEKTGGSTRHWLRECFLPILEKEGLAVTEQGELLDSGYQMICTSGYCKDPNGIAAWLAQQHGFEFPDGGKITNIDSFQIVEARGLFYCIAACRVCRQG